MTNIEAYMILGLIFTGTMLTVAVRRFNKKRGEGKSAKQAVKETIKEMNDYL